MPPDFDNKMTPDEKAVSLLLPGRVLFVTALFYLCLGFGAFFSQPLFLIWFFAGLGVLFFSLADALALVFFTVRPRIEREISGSLAQGEPVPVTLRVTCDRNFLFPSVILLYDLYPDSMDIAARNFSSRNFSSRNLGSRNLGSRNQSPFPAKLDRKLLRDSGALECDYTLFPRDRGAWFFSGVETLLGSPLRFWRLRVTHNVISRGRTYPDFKKLAAGAGIRGLLERGEMREIRRRGEGLEFESLRDYQKGDSIRAVDWRATSRTRRMDGSLKLIVRDYREEQDQQILCIIDSGYRLPDAQFDSALNAMLLLSYTALKNGDAVAAASFGLYERWIPPRKGTSALTGLMRGLYDLHSAPVPSSPFSALENALGRLRRRSFIILISNFREEDGESLAWILPRIERRHLLLLVSFRETEAWELANSGVTAPPELHVTEEETLKRAAAFSYLAARRRLYQKWEHSGLLTLETTSEKISASLINRYLDVKGSGRL